MLGSRLIDGHQSLRASAAPVATRLVKYSFDQLRRWRDIFSDSLFFAIPGVTTLELDEVANHVTVGIRDDRTRPDVLRRSRFLGIPEDAISVEFADVEQTFLSLSSPVVELTTFAANDSLGTRNRPARGGSTTDYFSAAFGRRVKSVVRLGWECSIRASRGS